MDPILSFQASGNPHISLTHNKTIEFTRANQITSRATCVAGTNLTLTNQTTALTHNQLVEIEISFKKNKLQLQGQLNPTWQPIYSNKIVLRKSKNTYPDTLVTSVNMAAIDFERELLVELTDPHTKIDIKIYPIFSKDNLITRCLVNDNQPGLLESLVREKENIYFETPSIAKLLTKNRIKNIKPSSKLLASNPIGLNNSLLVTDELAMPVNLRNWLAKQTKSIFCPNLTDELTLLNFFTKTDTLQLEAELADQDLTVGQNFLISKPMKITDSFTLPKDYYAYYLDPKYSSLLHPYSKLRNEPTVINQSLQFVFFPLTKTPSQRVVPLDKLVLELLKNKLPTKQISNIIANSTAENKNDIYTLVNKLKNNLFRD